MNKTQKRKRNQRRLAKARIKNKKNGDLALWKKFCLDLTTAYLPNLIANDLVTVRPMSDLKTEVEDKKDDSYIGQVFDQTIIPTTNNKSLKQMYIETLANAMKMTKK